MGLKQAVGGLKSVSGKLRGRVEKWAVAQEAENGRRLETGSGEGGRVSVRNRLPPRI